MIAIPRMPLAVFSAAVAFTVCFAGPVQADDDEAIALKDVPKVVMDAALKAVPGIKITEAEKETEDGVVVYELEGVADGKEYEIEITAAGKVLEVEEEEDD